MTSHLQSSFSSISTTTSSLSNSCPSGLIATAQPVAASHFTQSNNPNASIRKHVEHYVKMHRPGVDVTTMPLAALYEIMKEIENPFGGEKASELKELLIRIDQEFGTVWPKVRQMTTHVSIALNLYFHKDKSKLLQMNMPEMKQAGLDGTSTQTLGLTQGDHVGVIKRLLRNLYDEVNHHYESLETESRQQDSRQCIRYELVAKLFQCL